jgi:integrase
MSAKTKYPRYAREQKGSLYYQRDFPVSLHHIRKTFTKPLGFKANSYTEPELQRAIASATEAFELKVRMFTNTNAADYTDVDLDRAAAELLRTMHLKPGQFVDSAKEEGFTDWAEETIPGLQDAFDASKEAQYFEKKPKLTAEQEAALRAYDALQRQWAKKPKMLSDIWQEYLSESPINLRTTEGRTIQRNWERLLAFIGDHRIDSQNVLDAIHEGFRQFWDERRNRNVKVQSIRRQYGRGLAALRLASENYHLGWQIKPKGSTKKTKLDPVKRKVTLTESEQIALLKYCLADHKTPAVSACLVFMIQSGAMASEIKRLDPEAVLTELKNPLPMIRIGTDDTTTVKNDYRRRSVPIVLGKNYLIANLPKAIEWLNDATGSAHAQRLKRGLIRATGNSGLSAHCLRHTLRANASSKGANSDHVACICGWSGAQSVISKDMRNYGLEALTRHKGFQEVTATSKMIHQHLIDAIDIGDSNVIQLRK